VTCAIRGIMRVTGFTDGRIPWPKGVVIGRRSAPSIIVDEELARAVRHEAATAIRHWWGVSAKTVAMWRRELGVRRADPEGSRRLIVAAAKAGGAGMAAHVWTAAERRARSRRAIKLGLGRNLNHSPKWTKSDLALNR
jgi:predicted mannosyl-3-phosphoglycerate phosphatase (HAD superfamily)